METIYKINLKSITVTLVTVMLFSCTNNTQEVRDFLASKNLPIGIAKEAYHVYKDSGIISSKLRTPLQLDFSNRKDHPYSEFPNGLKITNFSKNKKDSITISGNYALNYSKTRVAVIEGNVIVKNHVAGSKLSTSQLFWDQKTHYFFSEKAFTLTTSKDTIYGIGFECKEDLTKHLAKKTTGRLETKDN